jgi:hypothetical protein
MPKTTAKYLRARQGNFHPTKAPSNPSGKIQLKGK